MLLIDPSKFRIEKQLMSNWCWAASTIAICNFYGRPGPYTQQQIVAKVRNKPMCAGGPLNPFCNDTSDLGTALQTVGHLMGASIDGAISGDQLLNTLQSNGVVGCQISIPSLGGHAVVIINAKKDSQGQLILQVADPSDGLQLFIPYLQFQNNFRGTGGRWIRTYCTCQQNL